MRGTNFVRVLIRIICFTTLALAPAAAGAAVVTNLNDSGAGSLRQAVADTAGGGQVTFQAGLSGTITLTSGEIAFSKQLSIQGPGSGVLTVKAGSGYRVFNVSSGILVVQGLTLAGGASGVSGNGGLIRCLDDLILQSCILDDGKATGDGGAVYLSGGDLQCFYSTLTNNTAGANGGALHQDTAGSCYILDSTISGNLATTDGGALDIDNVTSATLSGCDMVLNEVTNGNGGGIAVNQGSLQLSDCQLLLNKTYGGHGGGIHTAGNCALWLKDGTMLSTNTAYGAGGGIFSSSGSLQIEDSQLAYNTANGNYNGAGGGGIAQINPVGTWPLIMRNSTLNGNSALTSLAGGLYTTANAEITDSTFHANESAGNGAGMFYAAESLLMYRCTFSDNVTGGEGGGLYLPNISSFAIQLEQCTFRHNQAETTGGGIESGRTTYLWACTLTENVAGMDINSSGDGGGIHVTSFGYLQARGSILARNHDYAGAGTQHNDCKSEGGSSGSYTLLGVGGGCPNINNGENGNIVGSEFSPVNPRLSGLGDYGGPTKTCLPLPGSPARNANIDCLGRGSVVLTSDQRGMARPCGGACDMGAVEMGAGIQGMDLLLFESP